MSLTISKNGLSLVVRNGFQSMNQVLHASRQWPKRIGVSDVIRNYIQERKENVQYVGIVPTKDFLSLSILDRLGIPALLSFIYRR